MITKRFLITILFGLLLCVPQGLANSNNDLTAPDPQFDYQQAKESLKKIAESKQTVDAAFSKDFIKEQVLSERWYVVLLCLVSVISLIVVLIFIRSTKNHTARDVVNASGLNLIIFGTIILVLIVDTSEQLTAAIGVLGAIAGYLFGTLQKKVSDQSTQN